jgi:hypothetical protein
MYSLDENSALDLRLEVKSEISFTKEYHVKDPRKTSANLIGSSVTFVIN